MDGSGKARVPGRPRIALALQGGGAHGAYAWGVVERLLEEDIELVGVSGASAGAVNGAALVAGYAASGAPGATAGLERLWRAVSDGSPLAPFDNVLRHPHWEYPLRKSLEWLKITSRYFAPHMPGVRGMGALRRAVSSAVDLKLLAAQTALPLHISATHVPTGSAKMFTGSAVTLDAIMASACLPDLFAPVEIDGEPYWDGGFTANPALMPLLSDAIDATDLLIVQITPFVADDMNGLLGDRMRRVADISFNACLLRDLRVLTELKEIAGIEQCNDPRLRAIKRTNLHLLSPPDAIAERGGASKIDTRWSMLSELRAIGREAAEGWLAGPGAALGRRSSTTSMPDEILEVIA